MSLTDKNIILLFFDTMQALYLCYQTTILPVWEDFNYRYSKVTGSFINYRYRVIIFINIKVFVTTIIALLLGDKLIISSDTTLFCNESHNSRAMGTLCVFFQVT